MQIACKECDLRKVDKGEDVAEKTRYFISTENLSLVAILVNLRQFGDYPIIGEWIFQVWPKNQQPWI